MATQETELLRDLIIDDQPAEKPIARRQTKARNVTPAPSYDEIADRLGDVGEFGLIVAALAADGYLTLMFFWSFGAPWWAGAAAHLIGLTVVLYQWRKGIAEHALSLLIAAGFNIGTSVLGLWALAARYFPARPFGVFGRLIVVPASAALFWAAIVVAVIVPFWAERRAKKYLNRIIGALAPRLGRG